MMKGQIPYGDFWNKWFIILLIGLIRNVGGNFYHFGVLQFIALLIAGVYFIRLLLILGSEKLPLVQSHWFYIFIFALGFGEDCMLRCLSLLFILTSIWF